MYYAFPDQYPNKPNANFLSRHDNFLIFPKAIFNSVPRHFFVHVFKNQLKCCYIKRGSRNQSVIV